MTKPKKKLEYKPGVIRAYTQAVIAAGISADLPQKYLPNHLRFNVWFKQHTSPDGNLKQ